MARFAMNNIDKDLILHLFEKNEITLLITCYPGIKSISRSKQNILFGNIYDVKFFNGNMFTIETDQPTLQKKLIKI